MNGSNENSQPSSLPSSQTRFNTFLQHITQGTIQMANGNINVQFQFFAPDLEQPLTEQQRDNLIAQIRPILQRHGVAMYNNNNNNYSDDSDNNNSNVQGLTGNVNDRAGEQLLTFNDWNGGGHNVFSDYQQILNRLFEASETRPTPVSRETLCSLPRALVTDQQLRDKSECAVCKDVVEKNQLLVALPCNHFFHEPCITPWLKLHHHTCPLCRYELPKAENEQAVSTPLVVSSVAPTTATTTTAAAAAVEAQNSPAKTAVATATATVESQTAAEPKKSKRKRRLSNKDDIASKKKKVGQKAML